MVKQLNNILRRIGGHRVVLHGLGSDWIQFEIKGWAEFLMVRITPGHATIYECIDSQRIHTERAKWLQGVSRGFTRNDAGELGRWN